MAYRRRTARKGFHLIARLGLGLLLIAAVVDTAVAQRGRRARRLSGVIAARANILGPRYYGPAFYPPRTPPLFVPLPFGGPPPPPEAPLAVYPGPTRAGGESTAQGGSVSDNPQREMEVSPSLRRAPQGPQLRLPNDEELVPTEALPPPAGELPSPNRPRQAGQPRRGVEF